MIKYKTDKEIEIMAEGGKKLSSILEELSHIAKPGIRTLDIDNYALKLIEECGGEPSFKRVPGYRHCTCITVNDEVVHGLPSQYTLQDGDIVGIDIGLYYKGFHTDTSMTVPIGTVSPRIKKFLQAGRDSLEMAVNQAISGNKVWDISKAMETPIKKAHFSPVKSLTGHGIGKELHEEPHIPCFALGKREESPTLEVGMCVAIETIYNEGSSQVVYKNNDNWTIASADGSLSAVFEMTVAVRKSEPQILTPLSS
jgi:methionyl aminopeptidase